MTQDEIIEMAREAGFQEGWLNLWAANFERFAALVAAKAQAVPQGWQAIDSAPKGRKIIAGYFNELGNWRSVMACFYEAGTLMTDDDCEDCDEDGYAHAGWYEESESHEHILPTDKPPTHWMALSPAPKP